MSLKMITIRISESLHNALKITAAENDISMNQMCVDKLQELVPSELLEALSATDPSEEPLSV